MHPKNLRFAAPAQAVCRVYLRNYLRPVCSRRFPDPDPLSPIYFRDFRKADPLHPICFCGFRDPRRPVCSQRFPDLQHLICFRNSHCLIRFRCSQYSHCFRSQTCRICFRHFQNLLCRIRKAPASAVRAEPGEPEVPGAVQVRRNMIPAAETA